MTNRFYTIMFFILLCVSLYDRYQHKEQLKQVSIKSYCNGHYDGLTVGIQCFNYPNAEYQYTVFKSQYDSIKYLKIINSK